MIINRQTRLVQTMSSHPHDNWLGDEWLVVPPELESAALAFAPHCELICNSDGTIRSITDNGTRPATEPMPDTSAFILGLMEGFGNE